MCNISTSLLAVGLSLETMRTAGWSLFGSVATTASFDANNGIWKYDRQDEGDKVAASECECVSFDGHETERKRVT